jgi:predicted nucleotidyltransferase
MTIGSVERFLSEFRDWASSQPDIQAVALVGSYARGSATDASDVDLMIVANQRDIYPQTPGWSLVDGDR